MNPSVDIGDGPKSRHIIDIGKWKVLNDSLIKLEICCEYMTTPSPTIGHKSTFYSEQLSHALHLSNRCFSSYSLLIKWENANKDR